jgi:hypothetical protein
LPGPSEAYKRRKTGDGFCRSVTPETLIHIFMQCSGAGRLIHLRLKINNVFRQYLRLSVHSDYDAREQLTYLTADDPDIQSQPGWTRVHTER